jgi:hypothetical protein
LLLNESLPLPAKFNARISRILVRPSGDLFQPVYVQLLQLLNDFGMLFGQVSALAEMPSQVESLG